MTSHESFEVVGTEWWAHLCAFAKGAGSAYAWHRSTLRRFRDEQRSGSARCISAEDYRYRESAA
jgi:hypothetical protein